MLLVRRADFVAIGGFDERLRGYGWDDTDLYARLVSALALNRSCIDYSLISHVGTGHADRGQTWGPIVRLAGDLVNLRNGPTDFTNNAPLLAELEALAE